jgi:flagellar protein FliO/FliZ
MRRIGLLAGICLLAPLGVRAEDKVIYPRSAPSVGTLADKPASGPSPVLLVASLVTAGAGGWLLWRQRRSPKGFSGGQARKLSVAESRSLGNRQYLVVADYDGRKFLIGVCPGRIDMLAPLGQDAERAT